jgi:uncharacterized protein (DUF58 family)
VHLAERGYVLILATAVLAIAGLWSRESAVLVQQGLTNGWRIPALLLLGGLAFEAYFMRRRRVQAEVEVARRAFLGRAHTVAFVFRNATARPLVIEYSPCLPAGYEPLPRTRTVNAAPHATSRDAAKIVPVRLGAQQWPVLPARILGPLRLAWWSYEWHPPAQVTVGPDTLRAARLRPRGDPFGSRPRRMLGAGSELYQLRGYQPGDPLARIDWKATARSRSLMTREFTEDQHLDVLIAVDAGRFSRVRAGRLDRFGLYSNIAARLAEVATPNDDRVGLLVFADRPLAACMPDRGLAAVMRMRRTLESIPPQAVESDLVEAAVRMRGLLRHRALIVLLTDFDDTHVAGQLARAVRLLSPPHLVVVAGVQNAEIAALAGTRAREWLDPWIALAAQEHEAEARSQRSMLRRLGVPVIAVPEEQLEQAVFNEYETLRRTRRV